MIDFDSLLDNLEVIKSFTTNLLWALLALSYAWARKNIYSILIFRRKTIRHLLGKKFILVWNDDSPYLSEKISGELKKKFKDYKFIIIKDPMEILYYPSGYKYIESIMLFVCDVTKLSEDPKVKDKIQKKIASHLEQEGTLIGSHDIIYRRTRNTTLEEIYGCQTNNFQRVNEPVKARKVQENVNHPLLNGLPDDMYFDDGEICWGDWEQGADILIETDIRYSNEKRLPLLVIRKLYSNGLAIWLNSGDKFEEMPKSISLPDPNFIKILSNSIEFNSQIKN